MPKVNVQCDVNISPEQLSNLIALQADRDDRVRFWGDMRASMKWMSDSKLENLRAELEEMVSHASIQIAQRRFVEKAI